MPDGFFLRTHAHRSGFVPIIDGGSNEMGDGLAGTMLPTRQRTPNPSIALG
ncbi:hypothetical protein IPL85_03070 [Candidatus Saccharibacteria bacterium]|nr:MAG: hypothetical protein IPL85_03070 [Candidatus Saccharibacteria bacterium]